MTALNLPDVPLKFFVFGHLVLASWGCLVPFLGLSYAFSNYFAIILGIWALKDAVALEPAQYYLVMKAFTVLNDIMCLAMFYNGGGSGAAKFTAAMAIINLLIKPVTCLFIYKECQIRGGDGGSQDNYQQIDPSGYGKPPEPMP